MGRIRLRFTLIVLCVDGYVLENEVLGTRSRDMYPKVAFRVHIILAPRKPLRVRLYFTLANIQRKERSTTFRGYSF